MCLTELQITLGNPILNALDVLPRNDMVKHECHYSAFQTMDVDVHLEFIDILMEKGELANGRLNEIDDEGSVGIEEEEEHAVGVDFELTNPTLLNVIHHSPQ